MSKNNKLLILSVSIASVLLLSSCARSITDKTNSGPNLKAWIEQVKSESPKDLDAISPPIIKKKFDYTSAVTNAIYALDNYEHSKDDLADENIKNTNEDEIILSDNQVVSLDQASDDKADELIVDTALASSPDIINDLIVVDNESVDNEPVDHSVVVDKPEVDVKKSVVSESIASETDILPTADADVIAIASAADASAELVTDELVSGGPIDDGVLITISKAPPSAIRLGPFTPAVSGSSLYSTSLKPETSRVKENLEAYQLDSLVMVGSIGSGSSMSALISAPDKVTYRLFKGQYIGQNEGRALNITENKVEIKELIFNGSEYIENDASIILEE